MSHRFGEVAPIDRELGAPVMGLGMVRARLEDHLEHAPGLVGQTLGDGGRIGPEDSVAGHAVERLGTARAVSNAASAS